MMFVDIGLPFLFIELPFLAIALIPVVFVESVIYRWRLSIPWQQAVTGTLRANLWSTFAGVPLAWFAQVLAQITIGGGRAWGLKTPLDRLAAVTVQSPWLIPYEGQFKWMIPAAALCQLVPCLVVSVAVEQWFLRRYWPTVSGRRIVAAAVLANIASYLLLAAYWGARLASSLN
jgi:hypothetical protein